MVYTRFSTFFAFSATNVLLIRRKESQCAVEMEVILMTANQVAYQRNLVSERANQLAKEKNLYEHSDRLKTLRESERHSVAQEEEAVRHNTVGEQETARHNAAEEQIGSMTAASKMTDSGSKLISAGLGAGAGFAAAKAASKAGSVHSAAPLVLFPLQEANLKQANKDRLSLVDPFS